MVSSRVSSLVVTVLLAACGGGLPRSDNGLTTPYGTWASPISAEMAAEAFTDLAEPAFDRDGGIYWLQSQQDGRNALMYRSRAGETRTIPEHDIRTEIHAYGGGALLVDPEAGMFFSDANTHALRGIIGDAAITIVEGRKDVWYADCVVDRPRSRLICVREDASSGMPTDTIVAISLRGSHEQTEIARGHDFLGGPRISPDGSQLVWVTWDLPRMPWTGTELWLARVNADGTVGAPTKIAGGATESIYEAQWSPDGTLYFSSDRTGYWNLYRHAAGGDVAVWKVDAEIGIPAWTLDRPMFDFASATTIVAAVIDNGVGRLVTIDTKSGKVSRVPTSFDVMRGELRVHDGRAVMVAASAHDQVSIIEVELATGKTTVLARESDRQIDPGLIPAVESITYPTRDGKSGYAYFYPPTNRGYLAGADEKPPLVVRVHGGPTGRYDRRLNLEVVFWTSRGFAVVDVNHGGSTGHGREYRERLSGQWGVVDVNDSIAAAQYLVKTGRVDKKRLLIRGGSAGGYTTLAAVAFANVFTAGASWYGIGDIARMDEVTKATDKFESGYTKLLIGSDPAVIRARSPLFSADRIKAPVIFFQGADDPVVPREQSKLMFEALKTRGITTAHVEFPGEKHGFRKLENNARAMNAELYFYRRVLGLRIDPGPPPVDIVTRTGSERSR